MELRNAAVLAVVRRRSGDICGGGRLGKCGGGEFRLARVDGGDAEMRDFIAEYACGQEALRLD